MRENTMTMRWAPAVALGLLLAACASEPELRPHAEQEAPAGVEFRVQAAARVRHLEAAGVIAPYAAATLSTKVMGSVTEVLVHEGDVVRSGQPLLRIDARDLAAKRAQVEAGQLEAEAVYREAELMVQRMRALHADGAAAQVQLDAAETGFARARAAVESARAAGAELDAIASYSEVRAPFAGVVVRRMVDPGSFAAPGAPLLVVQDSRRLRVSATASSENVRSLARGATLRAIVEGESVPAVVEGVVPAPAGGLFTVNALVDNADGRLPAAGAAALALPLGMATSIVIPAQAVQRRGDLTGVYLVREAGAILRWIRSAPVSPDSVEVLAGLQDGDRIIVPAASAAAGGR